MPSLCPWSSNSTSSGITASSNTATDIHQTVFPSQKDSESVAFVLGFISMATCILVHGRYFRRFKNGDWITPDVFSKQRWIKGVVTSVGDSDNFRLYHTPAFGWRWPWKFRRVPSANKDLKDQTIHIRIAGVDAPEAAHFGRPAQPYSAESLAWLRDRVGGKTVYCQLLRRDQYSRIVANVVLSHPLLPGAWRLGSNLALQMLRAGCVAVYEQAGAEYGKWGKEAYLKAESEAKTARRGIWRAGPNVETPAEFKRRHAQYSDGKVEQAPVKKVPSNLRGWFRKLLSR